MKHLNFVLVPLLTALLISCSSAPSSNPALNSVSANATYVSEISSKALDDSKTFEKIAFGSCANQDWPQPLWATIQGTNPDLFLFMGDNVYASNPKQSPISEQYRKLDKIPEYLKIRESVPFLATWDDHDFGEKDGGADFKGKDLARRDFFNYWAYAKANMPDQNQGGIYHSKIIGPKKKQIQVIMLDTRYYRSPLTEVKDHEGSVVGFGPSPNPNDTMLGEEQWQWLEAELQRPADVRFIVSSIQLIGSEHRFEKWDNLPKERQKFFDLLKKTRARNVIVLSGDRHMGIIAKTEIKGWGRLYDVTASSINRPSKYTDHDSKNVGPVYSQENFGLATIDWKKKTVQVDLRDMQNKTVNSVKIKIH